LQDEPLQLWWGFDYVFKAVQDTRGKFDFSFLTGDYKGPGIFKYEIFPYSRNKLFVRFENIGDLIDATNGGIDQTNATLYVNVRRFAEYLYTYENGPLAELNNVNILEASLSGNQGYNEMKKNKLKWVGVDDDKLNPPPFPKDNANFDVALPRQRIRSFFIEYVPFIASQ
jgi:hypothetical protein